MAIAPGHGERALALALPSPASHRARYVASARAPDMHSATPTRLAAAAADAAAVPSLPRLTPSPRRLRCAQVILFHKFFSESETDAFIRHGKGRYEKSLGVGMKEDGTMGDVKTEIRTSSHGWCQHPACLNDPDVQRVVARVSDVTQTPSANAEFAQLVYYHACPSADDPSCAFYRRHNDYIDGDEHRLQGVRIYTLFGYMNDVPDGGGTRFTSLPSGPVTFQPQRGKAILWPSVLADDPHTKDERTDHEALPVTAGPPGFSHPPLPPLPLLCALAIFADLKRTRRLCNSSGR